MTDHYTEAERLLRSTRNGLDEADEIGAAQVYATLALADAVRDQNEPSFDDLIAANREGMQEDYDRNTRHDREVAQLRGELRDAERESTESANRHHRFCQDVRDLLRDWPGFHDAELTTSMLRRLVGDCEVLSSRLGDAERERDLAVTGRKARVAERDRFHGYLASIVMALGDPGGAAYADLPRLVRELRDERDTWEDRAGQAMSEVIDLKAALDSWRRSAKETEDELADLKAQHDKASQGWCQALESNKHLLDRIRELEDEDYIPTNVVVLDQADAAWLRVLVDNSIPTPGDESVNWEGEGRAHAVDLLANGSANADRAAEPASREPGCSNECSEMHTYEPPCDLATEDAGRVCGSDDIAAAFHARYHLTPKEDDRD